ncbi:MAG: SRPBCC family protein [Prevotellaceae bacterium]|jgi:carbon monoxide dehydrogenase subunit G|nr:SRPBCC family protein [Prevotellaceae bacterium]
MSSTFESEIKTIQASDAEVFAVLSDLRNVEKLKEKVQDKVKDIELTEDTISFSVNPVGSLSLKIIEREPNKTIKFAADKSPIDFFVWLQLKQVGEDDTRLKVTLKADLNPMIKMVAAKPLEQFVNMLAEALSALNYK